MDKKIVAKFLSFLATFLIYTSGALWGLVLLLIPLLYNILLLIHLTGTLAITGAICEILTYFLTWGADRD